MSDGVEGDPLDLTDDQVIVLEGGDLAPAELEGGEEESPLIGFADEEEADDPDAPALVKKLREQIRERDRKLAQFRKAPVTATPESDPEPVVPARKTITDFDYDQDKFDAYDDQRAAALEARAEWKVRQNQRDQQRQAAQAEEAKRIEQQKRALGVNDYEQQSNRVRDVLSEQQLAVLINGADDPAKLIYALGRSEARLADLASVENLAKFAAKVGVLERDIKVMKRKAPPPEPQVRGATASTEISNDKTLARLEAEADRSGDRSKVIAYKRQQREARAA